MLASKIKKEIKEDIREKFISLKIDIATRMDRAILGINIQLIKNGKLTLRTIAMKELTHRHTAEYIKNAVADVLEQRGPTAGPRNNFVRPAEQFCTIQVLSIISSGNLL